MVLKATFQKEVDTLRKQNKKLKHKIVTQRKIQRWMEHYASNNEKLN